MNQKTCHTLDPKSAKLFDKLCEKYKADEGLNKSQVLRLAIRLLAEKEGIT